jgi:hypothetical protein
MDGDSIEVWQAQIDRKVKPLRIRGLDPLDLPVAMPVLEAFLAEDGG